MFSAGFISIPPYAFSPYSNWKTVFHCEGKPENQPTNQQAKKPISTKTLLLGLHWKAKTEQKDWR